jgi:hypothetical protein
MYRIEDLREFPKTAADLRVLLAESIVEIRAGKLDPGKELKHSRASRRLAAGSEYM